MKRIFSHANTILYLLAAGLLTLSALAIMWWSAYEAYVSLIHASLEKTFILTMLQSVGAIVISIAILDVSKYMVEEEVFRNKELRNPQEVRQTISKIMTIVSVAVSIEGLVYIFKAGTTEQSLLVYPAILIMTSVLMIVGLGVYQRLSVQFEQYNDRKTLTQPRNQEPIN